MSLFTSYTRQKPEKPVETKTETKVEEKLESTNMAVMDANFGGMEYGPEVKNDNQEQPENFFFDMGSVTLLNNTTIYFNSIVEKQSVDDAMMLIKRVNKNIANIELDYPEIKGKIPFKFVVNSAGGNIVQGLRLFDAIKENPYPINCIANGMAASMGIIILAAGARSQATKHSTLMIHQLSAGASGKYSELMDHAKFWTQLQETLATILVENTKAKKEDIVKFMSGETFILAEEAIKLGLLDEIVSL